MKPVYAVIFALVATTSMPPAAYAHVLITDSTHSKGTILHINPDDDPIAGEESNFFLNTQDLNTGDGGKIFLTITNLATGENRQVNAPIIQKSAKLDYTFPTQGVYNLVFTVKSKTQQYKFSYDLRVARGLNLNNTKNTYRAWADILAICSTIGIVVILIIALNRRRDISKQSTF
ncbi:hypothetical protein KC949_01830 [Candidatus Saccharibacteria bacterium]|nr:hypothetical protein [Candidatus Saccharibacteria bacterium]